MAARAVWLKTSSPAFRNIQLRGKDFYDLAEVLAGIKGRFMMTINDTPEIREIFKRFWIEEVELKYSMSKKEGSRSQVRTELLIGN